MISNSLSQLTSTKYNSTSINCHISQRVSFCRTTFHYFRSGSSIRASSAVMCLRELEMDTSCEPGIICATRSVRFPHFLVDIHSRTPAAARLCTRHMPLSPRFPYRIFIGRSSAAPGDIKHDAADRASSLHSGASWVP